ncbi:ParB/RepB/Spo0J family partition protein [Pararhodobacter oceanensis]|uniref:ParB/RepB/Spo0J family partition protein n=1 Tax=Pararhodobacter oceanensis TaxID=2172121 RepID=UPI003A90706E
MAERRNERRGLGRGLSALMADVGIDTPNAREASGTTPSRANLEMIAIENIVSNPNQPRRTFEPEALEELSASIREKGILQPLVVRQSPENSQIYEIVAGERRWRASQLAQLSTVPAIIRSFSDQEMLEVAIIENIQREELNAIEEAASYRQLIDRFGHTQEKVAEALGKSRSHIANLLRLLNLPDGVKDMVVAGKISAGHARALITAEDPQALATRVYAKGLSVRDTEALAKKVSTPEQDPAKKRADARQRDADTRALEDDLSANLGMAVIIDHRAGGEGKLSIRYNSLDQLDQLCQLLSQIR